MVFVLRNVQKKNYKTEFCDMQRQKSSNALQTQTEHQFTYSIPYYSSYSPKIFATPVYFEYKYKDFVY